MELHHGLAGHLRLEGLSKSFADVEAVADVSIAIEGGEFYSLLGPSGCGKTTTLRLIAGFERPDSGRILLDGNDMTSLPPNKRRVNTVFQHYALFPHLTVEDNVGFGLQYESLSKTERSERLERGLSTVRLLELRNRRPRELSGGQQQRVALARALVKEPAVLLLDEPLAALDLKLRKAMQDELKKLQERVGITFVYVTHDQEEALTLSDRIAVMNEGGILQEGAPEDIYERPRTRFVADFIGQTNFFEGTVEGTEPEVIFREAHGLVLRCTASGPVTVGAAATVALRPERVEPAHDGHANRVDAVVIRRSYHGESVRFTLHLGDGHEISMEHPNTGGAALAWEIGARVAVGWHATAALIVSDEGGEVADEDSRNLLVDARTEQ